MQGNVLALVIFEKIAPLVHVVCLNYKSLFVISKLIQRFLWLAKITNCSLESNSVKNFDRFR
jgi:hypothetical protein